MRQLISFLAALAVLAGCTTSQENARLTSYVDTHIGTGGHGHVFVGANVPFGAVQLGPTSVPTSWDWCSGYHESDSSVIGFSHTHLSGTGIGDLFDITVLPVTDPEVDSTREGIADYALRSREVSVPGYYSVPLVKSGVFAEMTATQRVGFHRYTFPEMSEYAGLRFDMENGGCWDSLTVESLEIVDETHIKGYRYSKGWADDQKIWFYAEFSEPFVRSFSPAEHFYTFEFPQGSQVMLKVAISPVSCENARANLDAELPHWDFEAVRKAADDAWNRELGKLEIKTDVDSARAIFYTALYHTMVAPSLFSDCGDSVRYTTFSLWDTYRAQMPLYTMVHPEKENDVISTFIDIYRKQGILPVWHLMGCETYCMVGNPGIPVVADAILKGFDGFDVEVAYEAMKESALHPSRGQDLRMKYGYIPSDLFNESVAYDMEYAIADWALAQVAKKLGKEDDYHYFLERSKSYKYHFDPETRFVRGLKANGKFREPFNPFASQHRQDDYCEGNAWQYTWLVPHDYRGLAECFASAETKPSKFIDRKHPANEILAENLDRLFAAKSEIEGEKASTDISGMIGQYAHGNEPSHHIVYFYTMAGQPWKTADLVRRIFKEQYSAQPDGLSGNEDVGQMSAWYILSAMGFYQVEPAGGRYFFGSPLFDEVKINLPDGKCFTVIAENNSDSNRYIKRVYLNGCPYTKPFIDYKDIMAGGELRFEMSDIHYLWYCPDEPQEYVSKRPAPSDRLFTSPVIENKITEVKSLLTNPRLAWMFANCFPNTLDTTVHYYEDGGDGHPDTFVYTGDIHAMWLRDSGAQVWPYLRFSDDEAIRRMLEGTIRRQFKCLCIDPYANAFNYGPTGSEWMTDDTDMKPELHERKWEIDSQCYPIRLAYEYWKKTGDASVFDTTWVEAVGKVLATMKEQQRKEGRGSYHFTRVCDRQYDMKCNYGYGNPVYPVGLIASAFRPSDDATVLDFLVPSNFFAVTSLRKAAEILETVNGEVTLASECRELADEVEAALKKYAVVEREGFGKVYAYEVDGFGNALTMDDSNVPSLLAMAYLGDVSSDDPIYQNTRRFVLSSSNPYRFEGAAGAGIGGPHIGPDYIWPMGIMMRAFTSSEDEEIRDCIIQLMNTDAGTGFMHESFYVNDPAHYTRDWFAWQNTLFGELILKLIDDGKLELLNSIK